jgi:hypothetical protein
MKKLSYMTEMGKLCRAMDEHPAGGKAEEAVSNMISFISGIQKRKALYEDEIYYINELVRITNLLPEIISDIPVKK